MKKQQPTGQTQANQVSFEELRNLCNDLEKHWQSGNFYDALAASYMAYHFISNLLDILVVLAEPNDDEEQKEPIKIPDYLQQPTFPSLYGE